MYYRHTHAHTLSSMRTGTTPPPLQLIIADTPLHLRVGRIRVEGRLSIGSPSCRLSSPITLTFPDLPGLNQADKGIKVGAFGGGAARGVINELSRHILPLGVNCKYWRHRRALAQALHSTSMKACPVACRLLQPNTCFSCPTAGGFLWAVGPARLGL